MREPNEIGMAAMIIVSVSCVFFLCVLAGRGIQTALIVGGLIGFVNFSMGTIAGVLKPKGDNSGVSVTGKDSTVSVENVPKKPGDILE